METTASFAAGTPGLAQALVLAADAAVLVSWWKALILALPFYGWARLVSSVYDKHAARFHLKREVWNFSHLCIGLAALILGLAIPAIAGIGGIGGFLISFAVILAVLAVDVAVFPLVTNKDPRIPEAHRLRLDLKKLFEKKDDGKDKNAGKAELGIYKPDKSRVGVPAAETPELAVRIAAEQLVIKAREARAQQIDLMPGGKDKPYVLSMLIDGVREGGEQIPAQDAVRIIDFWKTAGGMDVQDRRKRQTGDIKIEHGEDNFVARARTQGGQAGMTLSMIFNPREAVRRSAERLGLLEPQLEVVKDLVSVNQGVVLLAAPPDAGRTTTMYSLLRMHDAYTSNVQTLELEIDDPIEGVKQSLFSPTADGPDFATAARSILRRDPDVVGFAEIDAEAAKMMARADHERTRCYVSLKTGGALTALQLWVKAVGDPELASDGLKGVIAQRLVRRLCENCRQAYKPSPDMLKKLGLKPESVQQLYRKGGQVLIKNKPEVCPACGGTGYIGQEGVFEVYLIGDDEREAIKSGNAQALRAALRKQELPTLQAAALRKAVDGITSIEEVVRVTSDTPAKPPRQGGQQAKPAEVS
ncbi:MAG: Flp pilus assembly complex ATPase component TadA [Phycisphaerales bacterium]|nr:Flp pilus assembly complex ATPase component TadA [Phycisphaerales bacterium]